jgi:hypothetical protein
MVTSSISRAKAASGGSAVNLDQPDNFGAVVEIDAEARNHTRPRRETKARSSPKCST